MGTPLEVEDLENEIVGLNKRLESFEMKSKKVRMELSLRRMP